MELTLTKINGEMINISPLVGKMSWTGSVDELGVTLDFNVAFNDDRYFPQTPIEEGDKVNVKGEKAEIGEFVVTEQTRQGRGDIPYIARDYAFFLNKSKETFQFNGIPAKQAIEEVCKSVGVKIKKYTLPDANINKIYYEKTYSDILKDIMEIILQETSKVCHMRMEGKEIVFYTEEEEMIKPVFKLAPTLKEISSLLAIIDPKKKTSIEEMKNSVKVVINEDKTFRLVTEKKDDSNIKKYGLLQEVISIDKEKESEAASVAENKLKELNRVFEEINLKIPGDDRIRQGKWIEVEEPLTKIQGKYMIWDYKATRDGGEYTFDLTLKSRATLDAEYAGMIADSTMNKHVESVTEESYGGFSGMTGSTTKEKVWSFFKSKGFSSAAIAGILGNLQQESGVNPSTVQGGGRGPGHGIMQWEGGRLTQLKNYAKSQGKSWTDLETQLNFMYMEMTGTGGVDKYSSSLWKKHGGFDSFKNAKDVKEATRIFEAVMERAGRPMMGNRYDYAEKAYNDFKNWSPAPTTTNINVNGKRFNIIKTAETQLGKRYVWASATPSRGGFDCSGYVDYVMRNNGLKGFRGQYNTRNMPGSGDFVRISKSQLQPGDVILNHIPGGVGHAGIYHGNGKVIHSSGGRGVAVTNMRGFGPINMYLRPKGLL